MIKIQSMIAEAGEQSGKGARFARRTLQSALCIPVQREYERFLT
jgi:hypothetical protein